MLRARHQASCRNPWCLAQHRHGRAGSCIARLVQLFHPQKPRKTVSAQPAPPALLEQPMQTQLTWVARRLTLPRPAVRQDQPPDASERAS